jgi:methyl-accepting chemotaxis protein
LAQRSAEAAREISELIQTSVSQIDVGTKMADSSGAVLTEILQSIKKVSDLNNEISVASNEQAQGIQLLSAAMNDFEQSTQTNTALSMELSSSSEQLAEQAKKLEMGTEELSTLLRGGGTDEIQNPDAEHAA